jgi:hypothetical protein
MDLISTRNMALSIWDNMAKRVRYMTCKQYNGISVGKQYSKVST